ncbi:MAG: hypothetical protein AAF492_10490 [Verrucomicrobiota bacterium]
MHKIVFPTLVVIWAEFSFAAPPMPPFRSTEMVSAERLLEGVATHLTKSPKDARAYEVKGQIHLAAFRHQQKLIKVFHRGSPLPNPIRRGDHYSEGPKPGPQSGPRNESLPLAKQAQHMLKAVRAFQQAIQLDAKNALHHELLAETLLDISNRGEAVIAAVNGKEDSEVMAELKKLIADGRAKQEAIRHYGLAHELGWQQGVDGYNPAFGDPWGNLVSYRTGETFLRLTEDRNDDEVKKIKQSMDAFGAALRKKQSAYKGPVR